MCTRNRAIALVLCFCLLISAVPVSAGAAETMRISASSTETYPGNYAYIYIQADMLENIASVDLEIYYDSSAMVLQNHWTGHLLSDSVVSVNTSTEGVVKLSAAAFSGISGSGELLTLVFYINNDCPVGNYSVVVTVGEAYDVSLNPATISGVSGNIKVLEGYQSAQTFYLWSDANRYEAKKDDVVTFRLYNGWSLELASATFLVEYDKELFELVDVSLSSSMAVEGAVYTINDDAPGLIRVAYASSLEVSPYEILSVQLRVRQNVNTQSQVDFSVGEAYNAALTRYQDSTTSAYISLYQSAQAVNPPDLYLETERLEVGKQSGSSLILEAGAPVAAADFFVFYDPAVLRCVSVDAAEDVAENGGMVVINPNYDEGTIRFSYINESGYDGGLELLNIVWEPLASPEEHTRLIPGGTGIVDKNYQTVQLDMVSASPCVYTNGRREPTCLHNGFEGMGCMGCGKTLDAEVFPALGHNYEAYDCYWDCYQPGYTEHICSRCGDSYRVDHAEAPGHDWGEWQMMSPPCQGGGYEAHWCNRCGACEERELPVTDHDYTEWYLSYEATCYGTGQEYRYCMYCWNHEYREIPAIDHNYTEWYLNWEATCYSTGQEYRYCMHCSNYEYREIPVANHRYHEYHIVDPSCEGQGYTVHQCVWCGDYYEDNYQPALGHDWDEGVVLEEPTEHQSGRIMHTCHRCGSTEERILPPLDHEHHYEAHVTNPSCTDQGFTTYTCDGCGDSYVDQYTAALGHDHQPVVTDPTCTAKGYTTHTCTRCDDSYVDTYVDELGHDYGDWYVHEDVERRDCSRCDHFETRDIPQQENPFPDVPDDTWYTDPVLWAVENNITTGKGNGNFAPTEACTRAQVVTFLWRAAGSPEPQSMSHNFTDVKAGSYYEKAVIWAVENGITSGKGSTTTFQPDTTCTRAEVVTFLWRAKGQPVPETTENPFPDVPAGSYYEKAVLWAVENGITTGKGNGNFAPTEYCTRAHVVTFLYRAFA